MKKRKGWFVGYADTDSSLATGPTKEEFARVVKETINKELLPSIARDHGCNMEWYDLNLAYEKAFARVIFAGKKRYVGKFSHYKGSAAKPDSKPEIKGFEYKRGDSLQLARRFQERTIRKLLGDWTPSCALCGKKAEHIEIEGKKAEAERNAPHVYLYKCEEHGLCRASNLVFDEPSEDIEEYRAAIAEQKDYVLTHALPIEEVALSKSLSKRLRDYAMKKKKDGDFAAQPPHVVIAKVLEARGEEVSEGTRISYVVVDGSDGIKAIPASDYEPGVTEIDRYYLWENLVYPPTQRLLEGAFPDNDWEQYAKARPPKVRVSARGKKAASPVEQENLFFGASKSSGPIPVKNIIEAAVERGSVHIAKAQVAPELVTADRPTVEAPPLPPAPPSMSRRKKKPSSALSIPEASAPPASDPPARSSVPDPLPATPEPARPAATLRARPAVAPMGRRQPTPLSAPHVILATSEVGSREMLVELRRVLLAHPGERPVELHMAIVDAARKHTSTVVFDLKLSVAVTPELDREVHAALTRHHP